ncbi:MAG: hypothetical protein EBX50_20875, partial [Chitinophagia bacterium]|nr:hypothetical protein [Chitinophagia bacterium]
MNSVECKKISLMASQNDINYEHFQFANNNFITIQNALNSLSAVSINHKNYLLFSTQNNNDNFCISFWFKFMSEGLNSCLCPILNATYAKNKTIKLDLQFDEQNGIYFYINNTLKSNEKLYENQWYYVVLNIDKNIELFIDGNQDILLLHSFSPNETDNILLSSTIYLCDFAYEKKIQSREKMIEIILQQKKQPQFKLLSSNEEGNIVAIADNNDIYISNNYGLTFTKNGLGLGLDTQINALYCYENELIGLTENNDIINFSLNLDTNTIYNFTKKINQQNIITSSISKNRKELFFELN